MHTEIRRTRIEVTSDPRVWAGLRTALEHICELHSLGEKDRHELVASVENECASGAGSCADANCAVTIDEMDDRVEVMVAAKDARSKVNSREAHAGKQDSPSRAKGNSDPGKVFVKHFQKNATHS
ncbi:MAG TPA: hypothetical protein VGS59_13160 [Candidatus Acidoferrales bacterium]|nr:hypothetical protein [Candidatus Acidoferrales bacterium]